MNNELFTAVEMIFYSSCTGEIKPLKFKIVNEEELVIKVLDVLSVEENNFGGNKVRKFKVICESKYKRQKVDLIYELDSAIWKLLK